MSNDTPTSSSTTPAAAATATGSSNNAATHHRGGASSSNTAAAVPRPNDNLSPSQLRIKLDQSRKELRNQLDKKRKVDRELANLEASIYGFEGSYLSDALFSSTSAGQAAHFGNIIKGYDAYLKAPSSSTTSASDRKRSRANDEPRPGDRMFSMSSATYQKAVEMTGGVVAISSTGPAGTTGGPEATDDDEEVVGSTHRKRRR